TLEDCGMLLGNREKGLLPWVPLWSGIAILSLIGLAQADSIRVYAGRTSVAQGEAITFHVSTDLPDFSLRIYRFGAQVELVDEVPGLAGHLYPTPDDAYAHGCGWPAALTYTIPLHWRSGVYAAYCTQGQNYTLCPFVVRERAPGSISRTL